MDVVRWAWIGSGWQGEWASVTSAFWLLLGLGLLISALGFYRLVYFVSLGYAFSITAMAGVSLSLYGGQASGLALLHVALLAFYGLRLGSYLIARERQPSFKKELEEIQKRGFGIGRPKQIGIWFGVALLYVLMFSPGFFHLISPRPAGGGWLALQSFGLLLAALGLGLEALADHQKARFKASNPSKFCDVGLYRVIRCPNYFGEIVFWFGSWLAALPLYTGFLRILMAGFGLLCIVLIMMGSTKRLEQKQDERYGTSEAYQSYVRSVPVLFPFLPIYTLKGVRVYIE